MSTSYERLAAIDKAHLWHPFTQMKDYVRSEPLIIERGDGVMLYDVQGRGYYDGFSSVWLNVHGHNVPELNRAEHSSGLAGIIIEVESDATPDNLARIAFWESCGFVATDYVHRYFWVPEPYRAMVLRFRDGDDSLPLDGELLFRHINAFHAKAYRKR